MSSLQSHCFLQVIGHCRYCSLVPVSTGVEILILDKSTKSIDLQIQTDNLLNDDVIYLS